MLTIAPDDLYPSADQKPSPLIGRSYTVTWRYYCKMRGWILHTRTGMQLVDVVTGCPPICLIFERRSGWIVDTIPIDWDQLREMEPEVVKK